MAERADNSASSLASSGAAGGRGLERADNSAGSLASADAGGGGGRPFPGRQSAGKRARADAGVYMRGMRPGHLINCAAVHGTPCLALFALATMPSLTFTSRTLASRKGDAGNPAYLAAFAGDAGNPAPGLPIAAGNPAAMV